MRNNRRWTLGQKRIDERPWYEPRCVDLIHKLAAALRGIRVVEDKGGRMPLGLNLGCWREWEYKGKSKSRRLWEWGINTTEPDTLFDKYLLTEYSKLSTKKFYLPQIFPNQTWRPTYWRIRLPDSLSSNKLYHL